MKSVGSFQITLRRRVSGVLLGCFAAACSSGGDSAEQPPVTRPGEVGPVEAMFGDQAVDPAAGDGLGGRACIGRAAGAELIPAILELVVDTSGSMGQRAPGSRRSKWEVTRDVVLEAIDVLPASTSLGVVFYPDQDTARGACFDADADVAIGALGDPGSRQRRQIQSAFRDQRPEGGTPTHDAFLFGMQELESSTELGQRYAVVVTDGTPTFARGCVGTGLLVDPVDPAPLVPEARGALGRGLQTFVIGSPGSEEAREALSRMAEAGGTAPFECSHEGPNFCHFDMTQEEDFAAALRDAFGVIAGRALSCVYDVPEPPAGEALELGAVNVLFTPEGGPPELIRQSSAQGPCAAGWRYSEDASQVLLCGATCDRVRGSSGQLSLEFGCATELY